MTSHPPSEIVFSGQPFFFPFDFLGVEAGFVKDFPLRRSPHHAAFPLSPLFPFDPVEDLPRSFMLPLYQDEGAAFLFFLPPEPL